MSHVRRRPTPQRISTKAKRKRKKRAFGLLVMAILFVSIVISIVFIVLSTP